MHTNKLGFNKSVFAVLTAAFLFFTHFTFAQTLAPGAPGKDAQWASAGKQAIGTAANLDSKIWFTLQGGGLTEVYYPNVTVANVHLLQFVVVNPKTKKVETERDDATHKVEAVRADSLTFRQVNFAKSGEWEIEKTYTTDPASDSVLIKVNFETNNENLKFYLYYDPSLDNTGMNDTAWNDGRVLYAQDNDKTSALLISEYKSSNYKQITEQNPVFSNGFYQVSDGLEQLKKNARITTAYTRAEKGNVAQIAEIQSTLGARKPSGPIKPIKNTLYNAHTTITIGFGKNPEDALKTAESAAQKGFEKCLEEYETGWSDYVKTLPAVEPKYQAQFNMAAMVLKAHEDKTVRGANIASLSVPWGGGVNANQDVGGGYHLVWSRDLYQVVTAYLALGDKPAAERALDFLFKIQQQPDGSFPQNSWLDGKRGWGSLQLDEVAYPLIMAYQLGRNDKQTYENHVKRAADFLIKNGPKTVQERWEEEAGFSPSTIAAEIAGLVCAADIAKQNGDTASADLYLKTADDWAANVEKWTATTTGKYGDGNYYLRITQNAKPDSGDKIELNNGAGTFDEREIVDAGFLELVRLGIKSPDDPLIAKSVKVIDKLLRVATPNGDGFYRYSLDGYGEMNDGRRWNFDGKYTGKGRLWALLSGERGQYEIARSSFFFPNAIVTSKNNALVLNNKNGLRDEYSLDLNNAKFRLDAMLAFANEGLMIPEQIWDKPQAPAKIDKQFIPALKFGEGTGSATPLAWSMAQFIRLAVNLKAGKNLETPDIVYNRYVKKQR